MADIKVYTREDCISCDLTKRALDRRGIAYDPIEMTDEIAADFRSQGYLSAPVVVTPEGSWYGLRPDFINAVWKAERDRVGRQEGDHSA